MSNGQPGGNRKRPFGATFRSLHDITNNSVGVGSFGNNAASSTSSSSVPSAANARGNKIAVQHIPTLPSHEEAAAILRRIHSEFHTIIERRGWNVTSITEMCCCGDGIDCLKKRKTKTMPDNVLGYNRTTTSRSYKVHDIHLRLRHPRTHALLDYESIAGTMCHELAHCVRGPHDAKFYKAMEEIEEQYAVYLAKGVVCDKDGFPIGSSEAHVLGSGGGGGNSNRTPADRRRALEAAEARRKRNQNGLTHGYVLGGKPSLVKKDPREAARIAAERRLLDSQYCLPCNEVIEILGEDSDDEVDDDDDDDEVEGLESPGKAARIKTDRNAPDDFDDDVDTKPKAKTNTDPDDVIDLTLDDSFTTPMSPVAKKKPASKPKQRNNAQKAAHPDAGYAQWTCPRCTLCNPPMVLVCDACHMERPCDKTILQQAMELKKKDAIEDVKEREVQQSRETFGGFNIYGDRKDPTSTMDHLT